ncbi:MAG: hypothetical protein LUG99_04150 [Lachnospiraceae bacterium]|nr:hypothetical protein [Lachnospiraceae bacterium]
MNSEDMEYYTVDREAEIPLENRRAEVGSSFTIAATFEQEGLFLFSLSAASHGSELSQMSATLSLDNTVLNIYTWHGEAPVTEQSKEKMVRGKMHYLKFYFAQSGLELKSLKIRLLQSIHID